MEVTYQDIIFILQQIILPDFQKDLVALNLVKKIEFSEQKICHIEVASINPTLQAKKKLEEQILTAFNQFLPQQKIQLNIVNLSKEEQLPEHRKILKNVKKIIAIASGKGGVGKSTLTAALACTLRLSGQKVGVLDVDIYGPSLPILLDVEDEKPKSKTIEGKNWIVPIEKNGLKLMSIGFFTDATQAIVWRGPMASKALGQMVQDVLWDDLDYLLIDLPPGTGDIHLSLLGLLPLDGVILISTSQKMALADAVRGLQMFRLPQLKTKILGLVENLSQKDSFLGSGGVEKLAQDNEIPFLGHLPILPELRQACDEGKIFDLLESDVKIRKYFEEILGKIN